MSKALAFFLETLGFIPSRHPGQRVFFHDILASDVVSQAMWSHKRLKECSELEGSKMASFCDFFYQGKKEMKLLNLVGFIYV